MRTLSACSAALATACLSVSCGSDATDSAPGETSADASPAPESVPAGTDLVFVDRTVASGLGAFRQENGNREKPYIIESIGGGLAVIDHDGDGDLDVFFTNGSSLEGFPPGQEPTDALFENQGAGNFEERTAECGLGAAGWGSGASACDLNGDGATDLYVTRLGANLLLLNDGRGSFAEVGQEWGVADPGYGTGVAFLDGDRDGFVDFYLANYVVFDRGWIDANQPTKDYRGMRVYFGPNGLPAAGDRYFRNLPGGGFEDASEDAGVAGSPAYGFEVVSFDANADGWADIYVANDSQRNFLWTGDGDGTFTDTALRAGVALSGGGLPQAGMGIAVGDYDGDLDEDLYVTNFSEDYHTLYRNEGRGLFTDATRRMGLANGTLAELGWAALFGDFDADGDLDLFAANGHVFPQVDRLRLGTSYRQRNLLFENRSADGETAFEEVGAQAGSGMDVRECSRGAVAADLDGDGDLDILVSNLDAPPTLLSNETRAGGSAIRVRLRGASGNMDGVGVRVEVLSRGMEGGGGAPTQVRTAGNGSGFMSTSDPWLHFGLGRSQAEVWFRVTWAEGVREEVGPVGAGRSIVVERGKGIVEERPFRMKDKQQ